MKISHLSIRTHPLQRRRRRLARTGSALVALASASLLGLSLSASAAVTTVDLGTASSFAVLAGSGITNTGPTTVTGNIGSYPTPAITGDSDITFVSGSNHAGDAVTQRAKTDLLAAYNTAAAAPKTADIGQELVRTAPYLPGVYEATDSLLLSGSITLDAQGDSSAIFIFKTPSTLTTATDSSVLLVNGASACNVYWQVGSTATFGTGTRFVGNVLADTSIIAKTGATFDGRLLANNGAVTLDTNTITGTACTKAAGGGTGGGGTAAAGAATAGTATDGAAAAGTATDGAAAAGTATDGGATAGTATDGGATAGTATDGGATAGTTADGGVGTATDSATDAGVDSSGDTTSTDGESDLPNTGAPSLSGLWLSVALLAAGLLVIAAGRSMSTGTKIPPTHRR